MMRRSTHGVLVGFIFLLFAVPVCAADPAPLKIEGRIQARFQWDDDVKEFTIPRARLGAKGQAYPQIQYKLEIDAVPANDKPGTRVTLKDATLVLTGYEWAHLTVGHFKVPFARAELTSSKNLQFILRPEAVEKEAPKRDVGVMVSRFLFDQRFEYAAGIFNGNGTLNGSEDAELAWAMRIAFHPLGQLPYSEGDLESTLDLRLAVGAALYYNESPLLGGRDERKWTVDAALRRQGVSVDGGYLAGDPFDRGAYVSGGVLLFGRWEPAGRYEVFKREGETLHATTLGLNYFVWGHDVKVQVNETFGGDHGPDAFLVQLQATF